MEAVLGFHRGPDPFSIKVYQCSILLGDWKHEFCFGSGRAIFNAKTDAEDEAPTFRAPDVKSQIIGRDPDAGKYCWQKERCQKDEMASPTQWTCLRKLRKIVKDEVACFAAVHVITKCQT